MIRKKSDTSPAGAFHTSSRTTLDSTVQHSGARQLRYRRVEAPRACKYCHSSPASRPHQPGSVCFRTYHFRAAHPTLLYQPPRCSALSPWRSVAPALFCLPYTSSVFSSSCSLGILHPGLRRIMGMKFKGGGLFFFF